MQLASIVRRLQCAHSAPQAFALLRNYNDPLSPIEAKELAKCQADRREQIESGLSVEPMSDKMQELMTHPVHAIHPVKVIVQVILAISRVPSVSVEMQRQLQKELLPFIVAQTPLTRHEWCFIIQSALEMESALYEEQSVLRCVEQILRFAASVLFISYKQNNTPMKTKNNPNAHKAVFSVTSQRKAHHISTDDNNSTLLDNDDDDDDDNDCKNSNDKATTNKMKMKEYTPIESYVLFLQLLTRVFRAHAILHARHGKHSLRQTPTRNEVFLTSKPVRRLHSFLSPCDWIDVFGICCSGGDNKEQERNKQSIIKALGVVDSVALAIILQTMQLASETLNVKGKKCTAHVKAGSAASNNNNNMCHPINCYLDLGKEELVAMIKSQPELLSTLLGKRNIVSCSLPLRVQNDNCDAIFQSCLYNMSLTTTSRDAFYDYLAILRASSPVALQSYLTKRGVDGFTQLFIPFVNNTKTLSVSVAHELGVCYGALMKQLLQSTLVYDIAQSEEEVGEGELDEGEDLQEQVEIATEEHTSGTQAKDQLLKELVQLLFQATANVVSNRCRAAPEKTSVLHLVCEMVSAIEPIVSLHIHQDEIDRIATQSNLVVMLDREVAIPVAQSAQEALHLTSLLHFTHLVHDGMIEAIKNTRKDAEVLRAMLIYADPDQLSCEMRDELICELIVNCEEIEVVRPDAFLALRFALHHTNTTNEPHQQEQEQQMLSKLCPLLETADVLSQFDHHKTCEMSCVASVACLLAQKGYGGALAMLLTHTSGLPRRYCAFFLKQLKSCTFVEVTRFWSAVVHNVFALHDDKPHRILSSHADYVLKQSASGLLYQYHTINGAGSNVDKDLITHLAEILLCCGHDHIQQPDRFFYLPDSALRRQHRYSNLNLHLRSFDYIFADEHNCFLLHEHCESVMRLLCQAMMMEIPEFSASEHVAISAVRGITLLLRSLKSSKALLTSSSSSSSSSSSTLTNASQRCFAVLQEYMERAITYFMSLDDRDRAIAADSFEVMACYEEATLRAQQLIKVFAERPPKGVTADDYVEMQRQAAMALNKGREALRSAVSKRTKQIMHNANLHKLPFFVLRSLGAGGVFDITAIAIFYHRLQSLLNQSHFAKENSGNNVNYLECNTPAVLASLAFDVMNSLLSHTPLHSLSASIILAIARLHDQPYLTKQDVSQMALIAHALRREITQMLPPALFVVLMEIVHVAFKPGKAGSTASTTISVATQHQLLGLFLQNLGQPHLPQPACALELLSCILEHFASLYKSIQQGVQQLLPVLAPEDLPVIERCLFSPSEAVCEVTAMALGKFAHFASCRRALLLAEVCSREAPHHVIVHASQITHDARYQWQLTNEDWPDLVYFLTTYGESHKLNALRIEATMQLLFTKDDTTELQQSQWVNDIIQVGGLASVVVLEALASSYLNSVSAQVMDYLCTLIESSSTTENIMKAVLHAGKVVLAATSLPTLQQLAPELQLRLAKPPKEASNVKKEQYLATSTVWLTMTSCRLQETQLLESIIEQQSRNLTNSQSEMVHRCVCEAMTEITHNNEAVRTSPKLDEFVEKCVKQIFYSGSYIKKKAHAWGLVGVLQGLGLPSLRRYGITELIRTSVKEKQTEKSGAMVLMEVMCDVMGNKFEPYALALSQILLEGVADPDPKISECADDASRVLMRFLSPIGLQQLIPHLIHILSSEQAKKRVAPLNFISYVAFCSPKELAVTLPHIMRHITSCLFDVNNAVAVAAFGALRRVAGVVSNPEIQEHVELILRAMRSPSTETENALDALLYTRFVNLVDPASLALIIPVISRGLGGQQSSSSRPKAAQIVASMVHLVNDPKTLEPYTEDLVKLLEEASQDPMAEARTTAARALGVLASAMGSHLMENITNWCFSVLQRIHSNAIEKAGAAQVFVELVHACGNELLTLYFPTMEKGMTDERPPVREGFLYIMVYAPSTFTAETFQGFLPLSFPWVLDGLSHFSDKVRDVALIAGNNIISLYGTRNITLVLEPLLNGVVSDITTVRQSSLLLSAKLLLHLVSQIRTKMRIQALTDNNSNNNNEESADGKEATHTNGAVVNSVSLDVMQQIAGEENETGVITVEIARTAEKRGISILGNLEEMIGAKQMVQLLSAIYCGRNEHNGNVRADCNSAWQASVASIRTAVNKMFDILVQLLTFYASSDNQDCVEVAAKTIEYTSSMSEMVEKFVDAFCDAYKTGSNRTRLGALMGLSTVVQFADNKKLISMGGQILGCVSPGMQDSVESVREAARQVFARVTHTVGNRFIESAVEAQMSTSVCGVVEVVKVKPGIALALIFKYLNNLSTYNENNLELIDSIVDVESAESYLMKYLDDMVQLYLNFMVQDLPGASESFQKFVEFIPHDRDSTPIEYFVKALNVPHMRHAALMMAEAYALGTTIDNIEGINIVFRCVITALGDANSSVNNDDDDDDANVDGSKKNQSMKDTRACAVRIIPNLINSLEKRVIDCLHEDERQDLTSSKRAAGRYLLQFMETFHSALGVTARSFICPAAHVPYFTVLAEGNPRLFDTLMNLYNRGLDYGNASQKIIAVDCIQELLQFAPSELSSNATNTVAGRCSKVLFTRNEGSVVEALVRLCLQLLAQPANGKEKMVEGTMALAMFNAALCDSGAARVLALRIVVQLLQRSVKYADLILGTILTKRTAVDSPLYRTVLCRFVSVVMRYAHYEKASLHISKLVDWIRPMWEMGDTPAQVASGGVAMGALCQSSSVSEEDVHDMKERTLQMTCSSGLRALAGFAMTYALVLSALPRVDQVFLNTASEHLASAAMGNSSSDKMSSMWILRAAGAIAKSGKVRVEDFMVEAYVPVLKRISSNSNNNNDEQAISSAAFFVESVNASYPTAAALHYSSFKFEHSSQWNCLGSFDADFDDEVNANTVY